MIAQPCPLCSSGGFRVILPRPYVLRGTPLDLVQCETCTLLRVQPMPEPDEVRALYSGEYFERDFGCGMREGNYLEGEASRLPEYQEILSALKAFRSQGRLLEVGCAAGSFLDQARQAGYDVEGVDVSAWASDQARDRYGIRVRVGRLPEVNLPNQSFDLAFMGDLLEHEPDPLRLMQEVHRLLKPGGVVGLKVPTYVSSFYFRWAQRIPSSLLSRFVDRGLLETMKLEPSEKEMPPYHLYEFSRKTLSELCVKSGFQVVAHQTTLLLPESLANAGLRDRCVYGVFVLFKTLVKTLNLPAGHLLLLAQKE